APPRSDPRRPAVERGVAVAAGVQLLVAVQAEGDEVGGQGLEQRTEGGGGGFPERGAAAGGVGDDERDPVPPKQRDERRVDEARMANLDRVADRPRAVDGEPGAAGEALVVALGERERRRGV